VTGAQKAAAFREADAFCFPTYYQNESQPVSLIEAMAFGLPVLTTAWRSIPELLPADYPGLVGIRSPQQVAEALLNVMTSELGQSLRGIFLQKFTVEAYLQGMAEAFHSLETESPPDIAGRLMPALPR
jgi:glycosyltransferase involved in cell wall biosynthesis